MNFKLLAEQHLEFLSLKGGCTGWSDSTLVKMPHGCKSHVKAHIFLYFTFQSTFYAISSHQYVFNDPLHSYRKSVIRIGG